jgi:hypothetical protein
MAKAKKKTPKKKVAAKKPAVRKTPAKKVTAKKSVPKMGGTNKKTPPPSGMPVAKLIDERIKELADWRGETLAKMRALIKQADPEVVEEWKWGNPVWSHTGIICTGETYKTTVKLTFQKGALLKDPTKLFNSSLEGKIRRAIDIREGEMVDQEAFKKLFLAGVSLNQSASKK